MTNTFAVGGDIEVRRLGFGAMRITGPGIWGPPRDRAAARALLRRAVDLGVQVIDTADAMAPAFQRSSSQKLSSPTTACSSRPRAATNAPAPVASQPPES
jgi:pyridoxine 4-dehydrogenase